MQKAMTQIDRGDRDRAGEDCQMRLESAKSNLAPQRADFPTALVGATGAFCVAIGLGVVFHLGVELPAVRVLNCRRRGSEKPSVTRRAGKGA